VLVEDFSYTPIEALIEGALHAPGKGLIVIADHITDEGNLGALIRASAFFGAHGIIIPKDRSAGIGPRLLKRASGGHLHLDISRVVNLGRCLRLLDSKGFWIFGAAGGAPDSIYSVDWNCHVALVLGSEQKGLSKSVEKRCHQLVSIPRIGNMESLNVAVACGVILSEIVRRRYRAGP
jgi:23S rRNA (guanosine2251-2'-O)-methyltransferase